ncbi:MULTISPECIES: N-acetyl-gamma-glutamyl-phosphate reductase [Acidiplasma]|uniref:N-acetyl-gamma-glutamyl-phosphate reductase n=1 Tax=Acidiplasma TaxID=507753 RepID=UPI001E57A271|nr:MULTISPECIES: N-acetyl-gamma-glutamyl-phosphate reductase [Acidiplasma]WMT55697.1 MAG: N-acetyl-gamma-glutamyl-phosphate reductase [Acidiplasma sp.]
MIKAGIVGASGYVGGELLRLLANHGDVEVTVATSNKHKDEKVARIHPDLYGLTDLKFTGRSIFDLLDDLDVVFLAVPHGTSINYVPQLMESGVRIVDMSADFRLRDPDKYPVWYGFEHPYPDLIKKFVYGMPELHREELKNARYIAVPGCIASSSIYSIAPFASLDLDNNVITVDAKVGSSGSGAELDESKVFSERYNSVRAYKPAGHRHTPEIEQEIKYATGRDVKIALSAHSVNMVRGILTTSSIFAKTDEIHGWGLLREFYSGEKFVRLIMDKKSNFKYPDPKIVVGSNFVDLGFAIDRYINRIVSFGAIDNMIKGASGNAIQSMNIMYGFNESEGLTAPSLFPV